MKIFVTSLIYISLLFYGLDDFHLIDWDENIYGAVAKSMQNTGSWLQLKINNETFAEKPPLFFWLINLFYQVFGINEYATRFTSVIFGFLSFISIYWIGKNTKGSEFGYYASLVYTSSFLPQFLSRTAYIDHTFNFFLLWGVFSAYSVSISIEKNTKESFFWSVIGGLSIGLGILTKGPLALVVPATAYFVCQIWNRSYSFPLIQLTLVIVISISFPLTYYGLNIYNYGWDEFAGFLEFQRKLASQSLESHSGPFFYHWIAVWIGILPWSGLLLSWRKSKTWEILTEPGFHRYLLVWSMLLLVAFSFVQTKLPHYTSSVAIALSFFTASVLVQKDRWRTTTLGIGLLLLGLIFMIVVILYQVLAESGKFTNTLGYVDSNVFFGMPSLAFVCLWIFGTIITFFKKEHSILITWAGMLLFFSIFCKFSAPVLMNTMQRRILELVNMVPKNKSILMYKYLSFYPMFYTDRVFYIAGSYKFRDQSSKLQDNEEIYVLTNPKNELELILLYPKRQFEKIKVMGDLILLRII